MSANFFRGLKFAIPMGLILWALLLWAALAVAGCGSPVLITATDPNPTPASAPPAPPPAPPATAPSPIVDTGQIQAQLDLGGLVQLEGRTYLLTHALRPTRSGSTLNGSAGTVLEFVSPPAGTPRRWCDNDRVIGISCHPYQTSQLPIAAGIELGATEFVAANESDAASLRAGDWLIVTVNDPGIADAGTHRGYPTYVDWAQVDYVEGATVHTVHPFRMAFPGTLPFIANDSGLGFVRVTDDIHDITISNLTIKVDPGTHVAGIYVFASRAVTLDHVTVIDMNSDPVYTEESKGLRLLSCNLQGGGALNEFAESVDLEVSGTTFASGSVAVGLDLGTGFVTFTGNTISSANHVALYALYHVHDATISENTIGGIEGDDNVGVMLYGSPDVAVTDNTITGPGSVGVQASADTHSQLPELSAGDTVTGNIISGFTTPTALH